MLPTNELSCPSLSRVLTVLGKLAKVHATPFYLYDRPALDDSIEQFVGAFESSGIKNPLSIFLPMFVNNNRYLLRHLCDRQNVGITANSPQEVRFALDYCGIDPARVRFVSGIQPMTVLSEVTKHGVWPYLSSIQQVRDYSISFPGSPVGLRFDLFGDALKGIRHSEIPDALTALTQSKNSLKSIHSYCGTNVDDENRLVFSAQALLATLRDLGRAVEEVNFSGGFGYDYRQRKPAVSLAAYWTKLARVLAEENTSGDIRLCFEPGRIIFARAGYFVTRVVSVRMSSPLNADVYVDSCFTQFPSPKLTNTFHQAVLVDTTGEPREGRAIFCRICGSSTLSTDVLIPVPCQLCDPQPGDLLIILDAGAYGRVGSYKFLGFPLPAEFVTDGIDTLIVRQRDTEPLEPALQVDATEQRALHTRKPQHATKVLGLA